MAQRFKREILPATEDRPQIELVRSARRTRTISMQRDGVDEHGNPAYRLLIPAASTSEEIDEHIARLLPRIQRRAARRERAAQLVEQAQSAPGFSGIILEDIPLLVESGDPSAFDGVVVVRTPLATRLQRLVSSRGMSEEDARARIAAQATDEQREAVATWVIDNGGSLEETAEQVRAVWAQMTAA